MKDDPLQAIAFYLPQFHPIAENDKWWGKGFTEWTNVARANPLFEGHYQPHVPGELGFYDLRLPETREAQANLARAHGLTGFCYYHYWFGGRRVLQRPFEEVLGSGKPDFPFCLCWANENWTRRWDGQESQVLLEQRYSAADDHRHIASLICAFKDNRYIKFEGKPIFLVYRTTRLPSPRDTAAIWRSEALRHGLPGLYLIRVESFGERRDPSADGFDAALEFQPFSAAMELSKIFRTHWWQRRKLGTMPTRFKTHSLYDYEKLVNASTHQAPTPYARLRSVCPGWDNTARRRSGGFVFTGSKPELFGRWVKHVASESIEESKRNPKVPPMIFVNAWNEWAEGNHLEPCVKWGRRYLQSFHDAVASVS